MSRTKFDEEDKKLIAAGVTVERTAESHFAWRYFTRYGTSLKGVAVCDSAGCGTRIHYDNCTTSTAVRHLRTQHAYKQAQGDEVVGNFISESDWKLISPKHDAAGTAAVNDPTPLMSMFHRKPAELTQAETELLKICRLKLTLAGVQPGIWKNPYMVCILKMCSRLAAAQELVCQDRSVVRSDLLHASDMAIEYIRDICKEAEFITTGADGWTETTANSSHIMSIAMRFIDQNWNIQQVIASASESGATGLDMARSFVKICKAVEVTEKISSMAGDSAAANCKMIRILNAAAHPTALTDKDVADLANVDRSDCTLKYGVDFNRCFAHLAQLLTLDAIKLKISVQPVTTTAEEHVDDGSAMVTEGGVVNISTAATAASTHAATDSDGEQNDRGAWSLIDKVRDAMKFLRRPKCKGILRQLQQHNKLNILQPLLDNDTRWTSIAVMLVRYLRLNRARKYFALDEQVVKMKFKDLEDSEEKVVADIVCLLAPLAKLTTLMQASHTITLSSVIPRLLSLFSAYAVTIPGSEGAFDDYRSIMNERAAGSQSHVPFAEDIRPGLNTDEGRNFLDYMRVCIQRRLSIYVQYRYIPDDPGFWSQHVRNAVCAMLLDPRFRDSAVYHRSTSASLKAVFLHEWNADERLGSLCRLSTHNDGAPTSSSTQRSCSTDVVVFKKSKVSDRVVDEVSAVEMELNRYTDDDVSPAGTDPLKWWAEVGKFMYPYLAHAAKKYLCMDATSASIERSFKVGSDIGTKKSRRISDKIMSAVIVLASLLPAFWRRRLDAAMLNDAVSGNPQRVDRTKVLDECMPEEYKNVATTQTEVYPEEEARRRRQGTFFYDYGAVIASGNSGIAIDLLGDISEQLRVLRLNPVEPPNPDDAWNDINMHRDSSERQNAVADVDGSADDGVFVRTPLSEITDPGILCDRNAAAEDPECVVSRILCIRASGTGRVRDMTVTVEWSNGEIGNIPIENMVDRVSGDADDVQSEISAINQHLQDYASKWWNAEASAVIRRVKENGMPLKNQLKRNMRSEYTREFGDADSSVVNEAGVSGHSLLDRGNTEQCADAGLDFLDDAEDCNMLI